MQKNKVEFCGYKFNITPIVNSMLFICVAWLHLLLLTLALFPLNSEPCLTLKPQVSGFPRLQRHDDDPC